MGEGDIWIQKPKSKTDWSELINRLVILALIVGSVWGIWLNDMRVVISGSLLAIAIMLFRIMCHIVGDVTKTEKP